MDKKTLEKYSSAYTLSDMEIFIFPELLYALVLANIMSPEIWKWRDDPWFAGIRKMGPLKKIHRVKQYIMDHYNFNLDLETWGLTDKQTEISRFSDFIDPDMLSRSNALFGYEGDKYYFDMDIRRHFGLDKYDTDIIPYWKTETVEAMNAFRFKPGHDNGAGECVSLACLYAAALYIVADVPLDKIFLMGTPLHSQNFVLVDEGVITNNRRIVTKSMWFNGTELSALARRALENEQVTYVAHSSGFIHTTYEDATIQPEAFRTFKDKLTRFLVTDVDFEVFMNFLRDYSSYQKLFQLCFFCQGSNRYIRLERAFGYEHGSKNRLGDKTGRKLFCEMDEEDLFLQPIDHRYRIDQDSDLFTLKPAREFISAIQEHFPAIGNHRGFLDDLKKFLHTSPRLPSTNKNYSVTPDQHLGILPGMEREEIISRVAAVRAEGSVTADLAFHAGRYLDQCDWKPFLKALFERNPVSLAFFDKKGTDEVYLALKEISDDSIYEGNRLALPDEVINYQRGDGIEKALTLAHVMRHHDKMVPIRLIACQHEVSLSGKGYHYAFSSRKDFKKIDLSL
jgi:hypothetical protein